MKTKLNRLLAVILSVILLTGCLIPGMQFVTGAAGSQELLEAVDTAKTQLLTAWGNLAQKPVALGLTIEPGNIRNASNGSISGVSAAKTAVTVNGESVAAHTISGYDNAANAVTLYMHDSDRDDTNPNNNYAVSDYSELYFYVSADEDSIGFNVGKGNGSTTMTSTWSSYYTTDLNKSLTGSDGKAYAKVDLKAAFDKYETDKGSDFEKFCRVLVTSPLKNLSITGIIGTEKVTVPTYTSGDLVDILADARALNADDYTADSYAAFSTAMTNAEDAILAVDELAVKHLKVVWSELEAVEITDVTNMLEPTANVTNVTTLTSDLPVVDDAFTFISFTSSKDGGKFYFQNNDSQNYPPIAIASFSDVYFYIYIDSTNAPEGKLSMNFALNSANALTSTPWTGITDVTVTNGWNRISVYDVLKNSSYASNFASATNIQRIFVDNANSGTWKISRLYGYAKKAVTMPDTTDWSIETLISNASAVDTTKVLDATAFTKALEKVKEHYPEAAVAGNLKSAWLKLQNKPVAIFDQFFVKSSAWGVVSATAEEDVNSDGITESYYTYTYDSANAVNFAISTNGAIDDNTLTINTDDYESIYMYYKADSGTTAPSVQHVGTYSEGAKTKALDAPDGSWQLHDIKSFVSAQTTKFNGSVLNNHEVYFMRVHLTNSSSLTSPVSFSQVYGVRKQDFEGQFGFDINEDISLAKLVANAKKVDITEFDNTDAFVDALNVAVAALSNDEEYVAECIKEEWVKLSEKPTVLLDDFFVKSDSWVKQSSATAAVDGMQLPTYKYTYDASSSSQLIICEGSSYDNKDLQIKPEDYESIYMYYKSATGTEAIEFNATSTKYGTAYVKSAAATADWQKLDFVNSITKFNGSDTAGYLMRLHFSNPTKLTAGYELSAVVGVKNLTLPANSDSWNLAEWVLAANNLDYSDIAERNPQLDALVAAAAQLCEDKNIIPGVITEAAATDITSAELSNNILAAATVTATFKEDGVTEEPITLNTIDGLTDGDTSVTVGFAAAIHTDYTSTLDLVYTLKALTKLENAVIVNPANEDWRARRLAIFASDDEATLFDAENRIYSYEGDSPAEAVRLTLSTALPDVKYIAVRVYDPASGNVGIDDSYFRMNELCITGEYKFFSADNSVIDNDRLRSYGTSLIGDNKITGDIIVDSKRKAAWPSSAYLLTNYDAVDDGGACVTQAKYQESAEMDGHVDIYWDLGRLYMIDKMFVASQNQVVTATCGLLLGKYEIYISESYYSLYYAENKVLTYDNTATGPNGSSLMQTFDALDEGVAGRYVGIRITQISNDWETCVKKGQTANAYVRISEIAFYGTEYTKPVVPINLLENVPIEVYRTEEDGTHTRVGEDEFGKAESTVITDGKYEDAIALSRNGKQLDIVYNINSNAKIEEIKAYTKTAEIKELRIYASNTYDDIFQDYSLKYIYSKGSAVDTEIGESFSDLTAKYVRFSFVTTTDDILDIVELEAIGGSDQALSYFNLAGANSVAFSTYLQDKSTYSVKPIGEDNNLWGVTQNWLSFSNICDFDTLSVYNLAGGKKNTESYNILFDIGYVTAVDTISFESGASERYFPTKMNFYIGTDSAEIFSESATPIKSFTSKSADGIYNCEFLPTNVSYVRIEILDNDLEYYGDQILTVISEITINGLSIPDGADNDTVVSITDPNTGIIVDVLRLKDNDTYEGVQGIKVEKRKPNASEIEAAAGFGTVFNGEFYFITLLDSRGRPVYDIGGREVRISVPIPESSDVNSAYIASLLNGELVLLDKEVREINGKYYVASTYQDPTQLNVAIVEFSSDSDEDYYYEELVYEEEYYEDDYYEDDEEEISEDEEETSVTSGRKKIYKKVKRSGSLQLWIIILIIVVAIIILALIILLIIFRKKIFKSRKNN